MLHRSNTRTRTIVGATVVLLLGAGLLGTACGSDADQTGQGTSSTSVDAGTSTGGGSGGGGSGDGSGGGTGQSGSGDSSSGGSGSGTAPVITSFDTPENIDCHNGNFQEFTASWSTEGAERVTISIDGDGIYSEYPANGEASLPFNCSSSHTFLLTAYSGDGGTATRSVTLDPRNAQGGSTEDGNQTEPQDSATDPGDGGSGS